MFKNMKISKKLFGGFGIVLALLAIIIGVYDNTLKDTVQNFENLIKDGVEIKIKAMAIDSAMLQCRRNEKDFLLKRDKKYLAGLNEQVKTLVGGATVIEKIAQRNQYGEIWDNAQRIRQSAQVYADTFQELVAAWEKKGLDENSGIQGNFRKLAHEMSAGAEKHAIDDLQIAFLQLRRYEKDFHRTKNPEIKSKWLNAIGIYQDRISQSASDKNFLEQQRSALKDYRTWGETYLSAVDAEAPPEEVLALYRFPEK